MTQEKPNSLSVTDFITRRLGVKYMVDEDIISKIVAFQGAHANKATLTNNQIEFSGFGKFVFSEKRAKQALDKDLNKRDILIKAVEERGKEKDMDALKIMDNRINYIKGKIE
jgi:hypothetical protein